MAYGTVNADLMTTSDGVSSSGLYGFKNRILNGQMVIDQRNAGASVNNDTTGTQYTLDRWAVFGSASAKFSIQQNAGSVTPPAGYTKYLGVTSLAATSVGVSDIYLVRQFIEGFNIADLAWGTANAKTVTLSFQVYSSLTGTFGGAIKNASVDRCYPFSYSITVANTWTTISITIAGDTTGTWGTTNGTGMSVVFGLGVGSNVSGTAGAWAGANYFSATGATSVVGTNGATFYITGVQLEKGSTATSFDYRPYGTELQLCQRYCYVWGGDCTNQRVGYGFPDTANRGECLLVYPVPTRANPTITFSSTLSDFKVTYFSGGTATGTAPTSMGAAEVSTLNSRMYWTTGASFAIGTPTALSGTSGNSNARIYVSAEL